MSEENTSKVRKEKVVYSRVIVQVLSAADKTFRIVEDLGPCDTTKAASRKRLLEKAGQTNLAVIYWVG